MIVHSLDGKVSSVSAFSGRGWREEGKNVEEEEEELEGGGRGVRSWEQD